MATLPDWGDMKQRMRNHLLADPDLDGVTVDIEPVNMFSVELTPWVAIYFESWDTPEESQAIAAGQRAVIETGFVIGVAEYDFDQNEAFAKRDDLMGRVLISLMKNRTLSDTVDGAWPVSGDVESGQAEGIDGFLAVGTFQWTTAKTISTA